MVTDQTVIEQTEIHSIGSFQNSTYFTATLAYMIDQKFDDGFPNSGNIKIHAGSCSTIVGDPVTYNTAITTANCELVF